MRSFGVRVVERSRVPHATTCFQEETLSLFSLPRARMDGEHSVAHHASSGPGRRSGLDSLLLLPPGFAGSGCLGGSVVAATGLQVQIPGLSVCSLRDLPCVCSGHVLQLPPSVALDSLASVDFCVSLSVTLLPPYNIANNGNELTDCDGVMEWDFNRTQCGLMGFQEPPPGVTVRM